METFIRGDTMKKSRSSRGRARMAGSTLADSSDIIVKRMTIPNSAVIASTAGNILALDTSTTAALVQSAPASEWASFAARYQQYRVRKVRLLLEPVNTVSFTVAAVAVVHTSLYSGDFIGSSVPGSAAQVLSDEKARVTNTSKRLVYTVDWSRNPNARLWNPTSAALPVANSYGVAFASATNAILAANANYFTKTVEFEVEFRGAQ